MKMRKMKIKAVFNCETETNSEAFDLGQKYPKAKWAYVSSYEDHIDAAVIFVGDFDVEKALEAVKKSLCEE